MQENSPQKRFIVGCSPPFMRLAPNTSRRFALGASNIRQVDDKPNVLHPGLVGMRGSMAIRPGLRMIMNTPPAPPASFLRHPRSHRRAPFPPSHAWSQFLLHLTPPPMESSLSPLHGIHEMIYVPPPFPHLLCCLSFSRMARSSTFLAPLSHPYRTAAHPRTAPSWNRLPVLAAHGRSRVPGAGAFGAPGSYSDALRCICSTAREWYTHVE